MPLQATSGAASYDAFGGGVPVAVNYIEDVFSTYLYTGNTTARSITNNIDLSGKGGLVWIKNRTNTFNHRLYDTNRGATKELYSNLTDAQTTDADSLTAFNNNGFSIGIANGVNQDNANFVSWTFREQAKFFDVVTYTGTGSVRTVSHNLGSTPGCIIVKAYSGTNAGIENWTVYHRSLGGTKALRLNTSGAEIEADSFWNNTDPTSTVFTVADNGAVNGNGLSYVAYVFAHNAGGFGLTGTDNVISCGSFTTDGSGYGTTTLGYEPQFVLWKASSEAGNWNINDNMRGVTASSLTSGTDAAYLFPNASAAENGSYGISINATGFQNYFSPSTTYIYIAIRRGPMKVPTTGTSVFKVNTAGAVSPAPPLWNSGFVTDFALHRIVNTLNSTRAVSRLTGEGELFTNLTNAEGTDVDLHWDYMKGFWNGSSVNTSKYAWMFQRAPSFFDEVCYTGTGSAANLTHNLTVTPQLAIIKQRSSTQKWSVGSTIYPSGGNMVLNENGGIEAAGSTARFVYANWSSTILGIGTDADVNASGATYVAYLFATCAGVSKVGSYTGTATTLQIDCGFTAGSRFVLIKRTDSTGDWYVWDSARGIVAGNDPYLLLNSTAAEVTNTDYVDTYSAGFEISSTAPAAINANGGTFIFLAIA
jgi:hypothetical protein